MIKMNFCHFNESGRDTLYKISLFNQFFQFHQNPGSRDIGHGAVVWDASIIFAKYVENNLKDFEFEKMHCKRVLELGSGCGLAGLTLMLRGAEVVLTDLPIVVTALTERNAKVRLTCVASLIASHRR